MQGVLLYISLLCPVSIDFILNEVKTKDVQAHLLLLRSCSVIFCPYVLLLLHLPYLLDLFYVLVVFHSVLRWVKGFLKSLL